MMTLRIWISAALAALVLLADDGASAGLLITEIFFNPPGSPDTTLEYIELRGDPNMALNDYYLIFLENENDEFNSQNPGQIENIFNLAGMTTGSNGYLVLAQKNSPYPALSGAYDVAVPVDPAQPTVAESLKTLANGAHAYVNRDTGSGFGTNATNGSIGHSGQNNELEGSGFTAMLIYVDVLAGGLAPVLNDDLDLDNLGLDYPTGQAGWTILDSISVFGEVDETQYGRLYSAVGFGPGLPLGPPGGVGDSYVDTTTGLLEIEYLARVGTGTGPGNWLAANLTNNAATGYTNVLRNYAISGNHANQSNPEVYVGGNLGPAPFAYGTHLTVTIGADNVGFSDLNVPEPSGLALAGVAACGLLLARRRMVR